MVNVDLIRREISKAKPSLGDLQGLLEERDPYVFDTDETLQLVYEHDHPEVLELLFRMELIDLAKLKQEARRILIYYPVDLFAVCQKLGVDVNFVSTNGFSPIHYAALSGDAAKLRWMASHGAKLEARLPSNHERPLDTDGMTPLLLACAYAQPVSVRTLLDLGANRAAKTASGRNATRVATEFESAMVDRMKARNRAAQYIDDFKARAKQVRDLLKN